MSVGFYYREHSTAQLKVALPSEPLWTAAGVKLAPFWVKNVKTILSPSNTDGSTTCNVSVWLCEVKDTVWGNYHISATFFMHHFYFYLQTQHLWDSTWATELKKTMTWSILTNLPKHTRPIMSRNYAEDGRSDLLTHSIFFKVRFSLEWVYFDALSRRSPWPTHTCLWIYFPQTGD